MIKREHPTKSLPALYSTTWIERAIRTLQQAILQPLIITLFMICVSAQLGREDAVAIVQQLARRRSMLCDRVLSIGRSRRAGPSTVIGTILIGRVVEQPRIRPRFRRSLGDRERTFAVIRDQLRSLLRGAGSERARGIPAHSWLVDRNVLNSTPSLSAARASLPRPHDDETGHATEWFDFGLR